MHTELNSSCIELPYIFKKKYNQNVFIETQREREKCDAFQVDATVLPHTLK